MLRELKSSLETRLVEMERPITKSVDEKIKQSKIPLETYASKVAGVAESLSSKSQNTTAPDIQDFRDIMKNARNKELVEERDRKMRSKNIIIHRRADSSGTEEDKILVENLMKKVALESLCIKSIQKIGSQGTAGPITVEMSSESDKISVLRNLSKLKGSSEFKGVSITEDYTVSERKLIQEFNAKAKEKTENDPEKETVIWRVRGSPKNGLFLKKFRRDQQAAQVSN